MTGFDEPSSAIKLADIFSEYFDPNWKMWPTSIPRHVLNLSILGLSFANSIFAA